MLTNTIPIDRPGTARRRGADKRRRSVLMLALCVMLAALLSSCGQEDPGLEVPLGERDENDQPLNPPTLRFYVSADGVVDASPDLQAEAGEVIAVVVENESAADYQLRLLDPDGDQVYAVEAPAGESAGGRATPREVGPHVVEVSAEGEPRTVDEFVVDVSAT